MIDKLKIAGYHKFKNVVIKPHAKLNLLVGDTESARRLRDYGRTDEVRSEAIGVGAKEFVEVSQVRLGIPNGLLPSHSSADDVLAENRNV